MDFEKPTSAWIQEDYTEPKPDSVFEMMEIMLPDAKYMLITGRGRLLELRAKRSQEHRSGRISIHEVKTLNAREAMAVSDGPATAPAVIADQPISPTDCDYGDSTGRRVGRQQQFR